MINVSWKTISPLEAKRLLANLKPEEQRKLQPDLVSKYSQAMKNGQWLKNHQGVAIDEEGNVQDGQHRLNAIVLSGCSVDMMVTTGLPKKQGKYFTFDTIDRGTLRSIGTQLQIRHGIKNGNAVSSICNIISLICLRTRKGVTVENVVELYNIFKNDIINIIPLGSLTKKFRTAAILGTLAFCHKAFEKEIMDYGKQLCSGENIKKGMPAYAARMYILNYTGTMRDVIERYVALGAMHHILGNELKQIKDTNIGIDFFIDKNDKVVRKVKLLFGYEI